MIDKILMHTILKKNNYQIFISLIIAISLLVATKFLLLGIGIIVFIFFVVLTKRRFYIAFSIISLMTLVGSIGVGIRVYVQIFSIGLLVLLFFKSYAIDFSKYRSIPLIFAYWIGFYFSSMIFSIFFSNFPIAGIELFGRTIIFFFIVYILYSFLNTQQDILNLLNSIIITAIIITISIVFEFVESGFSFLDLAAHTYLRMPGLLTNINATGEFFAISIPIVIGFLFYSGNSKRKTKALFVILCFLLIGLLFTDSRSAFASVFVSIIIILFVLKRSLFKLLIVSTAIVLILYTFYTPLQSLISLLLRLDEGVAGRGVFWDLSINIIKANPWFGIGPGAYKYEMYNYIPVLLNSWYGGVLTEVYNVTGGSNASHNFFLFYFSDMGIFGLLSTFFLFIVFFSIGFPSLKVLRETEELNFIITLSILSIGAGLFVRAFFESIGLITYGYITIDLSFWICFIIIIHFYQCNFGKNFPIHENINTRRSFFNTHKKVGKFIAAKWN